MLLFNHVEISEIVRINSSFLKRTYPRLVGVGVVRHDAVVVDVGEGILYDPAMAAEVGVDAVDELLSGEVDALPLLNGPVPLQTRHRCECPARSAGTL